MAAKPTLESLVWPWSLGHTREVSGLAVAELHDVREDAQADVPLLLLCAEDNEVSLVHLVDALNRSGRAPEVIAGVENDATLLSSATDRTRGAALFVLCQSDELDRSQVLRLSGLFSARKGPLHELLVVDVNGSASLDALPLIEVAMEEVSQGSSASANASAARAARVQKREVIVIARDSAAPATIPNFDEQDAASDSGLRLDPETLESQPEDSVEAESEDPGVPGLAAQQAAEQEAREMAEREAREAAEHVARETAEREAREAAEHVARETAEREAREAAERKVREDAEALARAFHDEMLAAEAVLERRSSRRTASGATAASRGPGVALGDGVPVALQSEEAETRPLGMVESMADLAPGVPQPVDPPSDEPSFGAPEPKHDEEAVDSSSDAGGEVGLLSTSLSGVRVADPLASVPIPDAIQTEFTPTDTRRRLREPEQTDTHPAADEARESRGGWFLAIAGAAALAGVSLLVMRGGSGEDSGHRSASVAATPAGGTKATAGAGREPAPTPELKAEAVVKVEPIVKAEPVVKPEPVAEAEPVVKPEPVAEAETPVKAEPVAEAEPVVKAEPVAEAETPVKAEPKDVPIAPAAVSAVPPAPTDSEALRVDLAIRSGKIRALDSLLVARASTDEVDWAQAKATCRRKRVGSLPGWRLPSRAQLNRLRRSRLIRSGTYWSRDRGPHDDDAFAVEADSGTSHLYLVVEPAARVQCVRKR